MSPIVVLRRSGCVCLCMKGDTGGTEATQANILLTRPSLTSPYTPSSLYLFTHRLPACLLVNLTKAGKSKYTHAQPLR